VAIEFVNWSGKPIKNLKLTLHFAAPATAVELASGGPVNVKADGTRRELTFDLDVADALIFR
jgi:hypothetical protein